MLVEHVSSGSYARAVAKTVATAIFVLLVLSMFQATPAPAYEEPNDLKDSNCSYCHPHAGYPDMDCESCHGDEGIIGAVGYEEGNFRGPHGGYTTGTSKCDNCHTIHDAPTGGIFLLPEPTIVATCFTCHDGTGGWSVYGLIEARTGSAPSGGHSYEETSVIPGGDGTTGGPKDRTFKGPSGTLICTDCHSPHGAQIVEAFKGDRRRIRYSHPSITSSRLLRQSPTGAATATPVYGSDWCLACHAGRVSGGMVMNHSVDSTSTHADPFHYNNVAVLASEDPTSVTTTGTLGGILGTGLIHDWPADVDPSGNRGFLMPYPRTLLQSGHAPICQQCHEDSRYVGELVGDGSIGDATATVVLQGDAVSWTTTWTSTVGYDNPAFQNFPHETVNENMLVEEDDGLCMNCHPPVALP